MIMCAQSPRHHAQGNKKYASCESASRKCPVFIIKSLDQTINLRFGHIAMRCGLSRVQTL